MNIKHVLLLTVSGPKPSKKRGGEEKEKPHERGEQRALRGGRVFKVSNAILFQWLFIRK